MTKPIASLLLRNRPHRQFFYRGLEELGYAVTDFELENPTSNDVLVIWNRLPTQDHIARRYEAAGAKVVVAENGWISGKDKTFSLCLNHHNGVGTWHVGKNNRWPSFGIELRPWRKTGDEILIVPQRGIGVPPAAMPRTWPSDVMERLKKVTDRPIRVRKPQDRIHPFEPELNNVHAVVTWASGAGIKSIVAGTPVFYEMPEWLGCYAARLGIDDLEEPYLGERDTFCRYISWAMWTEREIESGEAFQCLFQ